MNKTKEVSEWLAYAQDDLDTANLLFGQYKKSLNIICFHSQQAAEKLLKAYLVSKNTTFEKTHDLLFLLNICKSIDPNFNDLFASCLNLNPYAVIARYPSDLELIESDAKLAIESVQEIKAFITSLIVIKNID